MGPTLAHTHAILMPTRAASNVGMDLAYAKLVPTPDWHTCCYPCKTHANLCCLKSWHTCCYPCKTRANLCGRQSWHICCYPCKTHANFGRVSCWHECCYMQKLCQCWTGGAVLTRVNNCSSYPRTKKVKIRNNYSCFNNCKSLISLVVATTATTMEK